MSTPDLARTRAHLHELAIAQGIPVELDANGDLYVHQGTTTVYAQVSADDGPHPILDVWAPVLSGVPITSELLRFVAETSFLFGRLIVEPVDGGLAQVVFSQTLLAEPMTADALLQVLGVIATTADQLDEDLASRFGTPGTT